MGRAVVLAERGRATTRPNPMVGCVIVRGGEIVAEGWHERAGGPHAEVVALAAAGDRARGADVYVTLEPCDHVGRTGPCSLALLEAGVRRVVYAVADPGARSGGGGARLAAAGVAVEHGLFGAWAAEQNRVFLRVASTGRPFVTLKLAQTLDGALTLPGRRWITGEVARHAVHVRRAAADAVLVGVGTVLADDPRLDARAVPTPRGQPRAVVVDSRGRTPPDAAVVRERTLVVTTAAAAPARIQRLLHAGAEVVEVASHDGRVDLAAALSALAGRGVQEVFAEPGATLARSLVVAGLADRLLLHVATGVVGADGMPRTAACALPPRSGWASQHGGFLGRDLEVVAKPVDRRV